MDTSTPFKWRHFQADIILGIVNLLGGTRFIAEL
jgi:hypothetical protein